MSLLTPLFRRPFAPSAVVARPFSTTPAVSLPSKGRTRLRVYPRPTRRSLEPRSNKDRNPLRGVSPLRHKPQKEPLGAEKYGIPKPVNLDREARVVTDDDHPLWGFFRNKQALVTPEEDYKHGRAWTAEELRLKSWEDLHKLWWVCAKERNIIKTQDIEFKRVQPGYGAHERQQRLKEVRETQRAIKHVLTERYYAYREARELAENDPEVDLSGQGVPYTPKVDEEFENKSLLEQVAIEDKQKGLSERRYG